MPTYLAQAAARAGALLTVITGYFPVGAYAYLGTLATDGRVYTRNHGAFVPSGDLYATKGAGTSAADRAAWGRGVGMVRTSRMGLVGITLTGDQPVPRHGVYSLESVASDPRFRDGTEQQRAAVLTALTALTEARKAA